jgi:hypothetical protein
MPKPVNLIARDLLDNAASFEGCYAGRDEALAVAKDWVSRGRQRIAAVAFWERDCDETTQ